MKHEYFKKVSMSAAFGSWDVDISFRNWSRNLFTSSFLYQFYETEVKRVYLSKWPSEDERKKRILFQYRQIPLPISMSSMRNQEKNYNEHENFIQTNAWMNFLKFLFKLHISYMYGLFVVRVTKIRFNTYGVTREEEKVVIHPYSKLFKFIN